MADALISERPPLAVLLHALGGSARSWGAVIPHLGGVEPLAVDLPGFGDAAGETGFGLEAMADRVAAAVAARAPELWLLVGHSMGGKVAALLAARAERGEGPPGLVGAVLLAASPAEPEPMDEARRAEMIGWAVEGPPDGAAARAFVDANVGAALPPELDAVAVADVTRAARHAWLAWLERTSREDWDGAIGPLTLPAVIVAGGADGDLGEMAQRRLNVPRWRGARVEVMRGAGHLLPLERPEGVAAIVSDLARTAAMRLPAPFARLLASDRVGARTRAALAGRAIPDDPDAPPAALTAAELFTLRAVLARVLPHGQPGLDLASRIDRGLAADVGDGWRFADLPGDAAAYRAGLAALAAAGFDRLDGAGRDAALERLAAGGMDGSLPGPLLARWFEDCRADAVRLWLAHPATMARIGYDGIANGGDGARLQGFARTEAGDREGWEPGPAR